MKAARGYPVGVQVFEDIRERGLLYADKTRYVYDMAHLGGRYVFISRPRRFGKTLLVSTLEAYFRGRRELFEGLEIEGLEREWRAHPVLRLDLSDFKESSTEGLLAKFDALLGPYEREYGIKEPRETPGLRLLDLVLAACERTGERAVVLVDEYDAPLLNVVHNPERLWAFREIMREFYSPLKKLEPQLRFVLLTGVSKFGQLSVFSELNNLQNISMTPRFAGACGVTENELRGPLAPDVTLLAERMGLSTEECFAALKRRYDGYRFCEGSPGVYNPYSLVSAFQDGRIANYWFASGTPSSLVDLLRGRDFNLTKLEGARASSDAFDAPAEGMATPVPFMYQAGYLTIKDYDALNDIYTLGIPNEEVRKGLYEVLLPYYAGDELQDSGVLLADLADAVRAGDMDSFLRHLRSLFASAAHNMAVRDEAAFQNVMFLLLKLLGMRVSAECAFACGRADLVVETPDTVYVMELKYSRPEAPATAEDAVAQIRGRGYLVPWEADGRRVVEVGAVFDEEQRTVAEGWIIRES